MRNLFRRLRRTANKPLLFGFYGALGCLMAALLLGEPLLALTKLPPSTETTPQALVLLLDTSGSMSGGRLREVKTAASDFVQRQTSQDNEFAVISFASSSRVETALTTNKNQIEQSINDLVEGGSTAMASGLDLATTELESTSLAKNILLFTDGIPNSESNTLQVAQQVKADNINLIAVGTGDAEVNFLEEVTGDSDLVFYAGSNNFDQAFQDAADVIYSEQLVESSPSGDYGLVYSALRIGSWTSLLALGVALALIIGQNHYLRRRLLSFKQGVLGTGGAIAAGLVAGGIGQLIYTPFAAIPTINLIARLSGWTILGTLLGGGMSFFIPNLRRDRALLGGAIGGILGSIGFIATANVTGDVIGRLVGAILIGFFLGLMVALIEQLSRKAWLVVSWTSNENTQISLGKEPITLGCAESDHLYLRQDQGYIPETAKIFTADNKIFMEYNPEYGERKGMKKLKHELKDGDKRKLGGITLEAKTSSDSKSIRQD